MHLLLMPILDSFVRLRAPRTTQNEKITGVNAP